MDTLDTISKSAQFIFAETAPYYIYNPQPKAAKSCKSLSKGMYVY